MASDRMEEMLKQLKPFGWICEHPDKTIRSIGVDKVTYRSVCLDGLLNGVPRSIYLSVESGRVMLIGEMRDLEFTEFLTWLKTGKDPAAVGPVVQDEAKSERQRNLF